MIDPDFDTQVKLAVYRATAESGTPPPIDIVAARVAAEVDAVRAAYARLESARLLVLEADGAAIRMAPPFSGIPTQHHVVSGGVQYYANCAWDALAIPAALHQPARIESRCEQTLAPFVLDVGVNGPGPSPWLFHTPVPAAKWWADIVFT